MPRAVKFMLTESRMVVGWGKRAMGSQCLMEMEFQFSQMRRLKMDGDSCTTLRMYLLPLNSTLKRD